MQDVGSKGNARYTQRDRSADDEHPSVNPLDSVSLLEDRNAPVPSPRDED
jgi:hypothetical protein